MAVYELGLWELDLDEAKLPVCPLCENYIHKGDRIILGCAPFGDILALVHLNCVEEEDAERMD